MTLLSTATKATVRDKRAKGTGGHPGIVTKGAKAAVGVKAAPGISKHPGMVTKGAKAALGVKAVQSVSKHPGILPGGAKVTLGVKGVKSAAKHPGVVRLALKAGKPVARRKVRRRIGKIERFGKTAREVGETVLLFSVLAAEELGLVERPRCRPAAPLFASGVVVGAGAVYLFEPEHGREHRDKLLRLAA